MGPPFCIDGQTLYGRHALALRLHAGPDTARVARPDAPTVGAARGNEIDILQRYPQVAGEPLAMAMMCQTLKTKGLAADAFALGQAAMIAAPGDTDVRDLVRAALSAGVPHWHAPMLRDGPRNACYAQAIARAVTPGMRILEIGTGAGLLSLLAARAGAQVITCEANPVVAAAAREIALRNGLADRITVISKYSTELEIGHDLAEPADLLMSELFDDALFGDGIVDIIADARRRLLRPDAPILPPRAELRCALVALDHPTDWPLGMVEGFDLSPFNMLSAPPPAALRARPEGAVRRSAPASLLTMDFEAPDFGAMRETATLISEGGPIHGVVQWLRVDFGAGVIFENSPFDDSNSHWGAPIHPLAQPIDTTPGEAIEVTARLVSAQLLISARRA
jgi:type II protein arginine methyltransferase